MSSTFGNVLHLSIFGQSHSPAIGCSLDGIPAGITVDQDKLQDFLDRRAPGRDETATKRREADAAHIIAGVVDGHTTGAPIAAIIENTNTRSKDYSELRRKPRPGHADFPARVKYHNMHDVAGGGHFSGRLTAPLCIAGGIALQALEARGIQVMAHVAQIGGISNLASILGQMHKRSVLVMDLDKQANTSKFFRRFDPGMTTMAQVLTMENVLSDVVVNTRFDHVDIAPCSMEMLKANKQVMLDVTHPQHNRIRRALHDQEGLYD